MEEEEEKIKELEEKTKKLDEVKLILEEQRSGGKGRKNTEELIDLY